MQTSPILPPQTYPAPDAFGQLPAAVILLRHVYLEAGLPPQAANDSALADYECSFEGTLTCLS